MGSNPAPRFQHNEVTTMEKYFCDITGEEIPNYEEELHMLQLGGEEYDLCDEMVQKIKQYVESLKTQPTQAPSSATPPNTPQQPDNAQHF